MMLIRRAENLPEMQMNMAGAEGVTMRIMVGRDDGAPNFAMRHFTVEPGGCTPRHSHNYEHEVFILEGKGTVERDGALFEVSGGDVVFVEPNVTHQFVNRGEESLRFLCLVPVTFDCGKPTPGS